MAPFVVVSVRTLSEILLLLLLVVLTSALVSISVFLYYLEPLVHSSYSALTISLVSHIISLIHLYPVARPLHLNIPQLFSLTLLYYNTPVL